MRYFDFLNKTKVFYRLPESYSLDSPKELLSYALGATLYMPATRKSVVEDILYKKHLGIRTIVLCLEDSVSKRQVQEAEINLLHIFNQLENLIENQSEIAAELPLIFVRVRDLHQFESLLNIHKFSGLCGFIFPKFTSDNGQDYYKLLKEYNQRNSRVIYGMPILETPEIIHRETRMEELLLIKSILNNYREYVLNVRMGGTDFSGLYGLRRHRSQTIYDLLVVRDTISDIINTFKRDEYIIPGPVYEYFSHGDEPDDSGLIRETLLDIVNGLTGKTVIHPSQVNVVNSLMVVSKEEYLDAQSILKSGDDGVIKSVYSNKMNEIKPHTKWAKNIISRSKIMGVYNDGKCYKDLLKAISDIYDRQQHEGIIKYQGK